LRNRIARMGIQYSQFRELLLIDPSHRNGRRRVQDRW
jgi:hypothetical protein